MKDENKEKELIQKVADLRSMIAQVNLPQAEERPLESQYLNQIERLKRVAELSMNIAGDPMRVFEHVTHIIGELLDVPVVCISEIRGEELHFLSVYLNGTVKTDAGECSLNITPCATVQQSKDMRIYDNVSERFPEASFLKAHNANSYCGFPILDSSGSVVAVTCLLDDKPHNFSEEDKYLLHAIGQRIGFEIERKKHLFKSKQAEEALKESAEYLAEAQKIAHIGHWKLDPETNTVTGSDELFQIFGLSQEEATLESFIDVVHPEDRERNVAAITRGVEHGENWNIEHRLICSDGVEKTVQAVGEARKDESNKTVLLVGTVQDITERKQTEVELLKLFNAVEQSPVTVVITDLDGTIEYVNPKFTELTGYTSEEAIGQSPQLLKSDVHPPEFYKDMWDTISFGKTWSGEFCNKKKNGELYWEDARVSPVTNSDGCITHYLAIKEDITGRKQTEEALRNSEKRSIMAQKIGKVGIWDWNLISGALIWSDEIYSMLGYSPVEIIPSYELFLECVHPDDRESLNRSVEESLNQKKPYRLDCRIVNKNGVELIAEATGEVEYDEDGKPARMVGTFIDITERKNSEESIKHMAYYDHLTGLPNRILFVDRLDQVLLREAWKQRTTAVLFLDLDRFKIINDTLGHAFGDELLKVVARRLEGCLREGDTVARLGGDEFTILLQDLAKPEDIPLVLEKILDSIKLPIEINGREVIISTSIGVSIFPDDGEDTSTLLKNADIAMYRAKSEGKNNFQIYSTAMSIQAEKVLKMEHRLRMALDNDEFRVHYQPQLDLRSRTFFGLEALVRLIDSAGGKLIPPGEFISIAEETGLIIPISEWVLKTVCTQNKLWQNTGYRPVTIAVNISPRVFNQNNFVPMVVGILNETGLEPEYLEIEITEEIMMGNTEETVDKMKALREIGIRFAVDDFGTGYSSLSYIKMLPIDTLKIDRAFVSDINSNRDDKAIVTATINMAHSMDIEVLAEGVETEGQLAYLNSLGCDKLQGYLYSKPIPHDEVEELLKEAIDIKNDQKTSA